MVGFVVTYPDDNVRRSPNGSQMRRLARCLASIVIEITYLQINVQTTRRLFMVNSNCHRIIIWHPKRQNTLPRRNCPRNLRDDGTWRDNNECSQVTLPHWQNHRSYLQVQWNGYIYYNNVQVKMYIPLGISEYWLKQYRLLTGKKGYVAISSSHGFRSRYNLFSLCPLYLSTVDIRGNERAVTVRRIWMKFTISDGISKLCKKWINVQWITNVMCDHINYYFNTTHC